MYLQKIEIENTGPLQFFEYTLPFDADGKPNPVIFVGPNGSGKSIILAHIVNALIDAKSTVFSDFEVEKGFVFKLRSPAYITSGATFSRAKMSFTGGFSQTEIQASLSRKAFEEKYG